MSYLGLCACACTTVAPITDTEPEGALRLGVWALSCKLLKSMPACATLLPKPDEICKRSHANPGLP